MKYFPLPSKENKEECVSISESVIRQFFTCRYQGKASARSTVFKRFQFFKSLTVTDGPIRIFGPLLHVGSMDPSPAQNTVYSKCFFTPVSIMEDF